MNNRKPLQLAVLQILDAAVCQIEHDQTLYGDWSVQGFGMLRLYIRNMGRLHIWDSELRYPGVSMIHTHSWDLRSTVVSGVVENVRWREVQVAGERYKRQEIVTGYDCKMVSPVVDVLLHRDPRESYYHGEVYRQRAAEIHETHAEDGAITLMERQEDDNGKAFIYWPEDCTWGTAKPRRATRDEITRTINKAMLQLETSCRT